MTQYGTRDLDRRVPTVVFTVDGRTPAEVSAALARDDIFVWDGNYYALELMERLGLEAQGGAVRVGAVHYNTTDEIDTLPGGGRRTHAVTSPDVREMAWR